MRMRVGAPTSVGVTPEHGRRLRTRNVIPAKAGIQTHWEISHPHAPPVLAEVPA